MLFSIIINTHNQNKTISRCLKSCLNQNFNKKYEIILVDTSDKRINRKLINSNKIRYFYFKRFSKYPEVNQLNKIYQGYKRARGKWFCLMDGDDFYNRNKLKNIFEKYNLNKEILIQDDYNHYEESVKRTTKHISKKYKKFTIYKKIMNFWPEIHGTSSLSGNIKVLKSFFKHVSLNKWRLLAIDALIILYCLNRNKFLNYDKILTNKSIGNDNLESRKKITNKNYWLRRNEQIDYWEFISKKKIFNFDKVVCRLISFFI